MIEGRVSLGIGSGISSSLLILEANFCLCPVVENVEIRWLHFQQMIEGRVSLGIGSGISSSLLILEANFCLCPFVENKESALLLSIVALHKWHTRLDSIIKNKKQKTNDAALYTLLVSVV